MKLHPTKETLVKAMRLDGFENWRPEVDVPELNRPQTRPSELEGDGRVAAVMLLFYLNDCSTSGSDSADSLRLVLTKRHAKLANHAGQISFPGGRQDDGETLWQTALRETFEEIGVGRNGADANLPDSEDDGEAEIKLLGQLNPIYIPPSDFTVNPFVGWFEREPKFIRSEEEVDEIIEAPVSHLLDPSVLKFGDIESASGMNINVPYYAIDAHQVWGATAIILGELIERIRRVAD